MADNTYGFQSFLDNDRSGLGNFGYNSAPEDNHSFLDAPGLRGAPAAPQRSEMQSIAQPDAVTSSYKSPSQNVFSGSTMAPQNQAQTDDDMGAQARRDLAQANVDASATAYNPETQYKTKSGYTYTKPNESHWNDSMLGMLGWMSGYLVNGNAGEGMNGAFQAVANNENINHRFKQIDHLESKGYNPKDIDNFIQTGDTKQLVQNKAQWQAAGSGIIYNPQTGESKYLGTGSSQAAKNIERTVDLGDKVRVYYVNGGSEDIPKADNSRRYSSNRFGVYDTKTGQQISSGDGTEFDGDSADKMQYTDPDGKVWNVAKRANGTPIVDAKTGIAVVIDENGQTSSRTINPVKMEASSIQANETKQIITDLENSGQLDLTGGYRFQSRGGQALGLSTDTNLKNSLETANEGMKGQILAQLMVESGGLRVTDNQLAAERHRIGVLDPEASPEYNKSVIERFKAYTNKAINQGVQKNNMQDLETVDYRDPDNKHLPQMNSKATSRTPAGASEGFGSKYGY